MVTAWEDAPTTPIPVERMAEMVLAAIGAVDERPTFSTDWSDDELTTIDMEVQR